MKNVSQGKPSLVQTRLQSVTELLSLNLSGSMFILTTTTWRNYTICLTPSTSLFALSFLTYRRRTTYQQSTMHVLTDGQPDSSVVILSTLTPTARLQLEQQPGSTRFMPLLMRINIKCLKSGQRATIPLKLGSGEPSLIGCLHVVLSDNDENTVEAQPIA